jgi:hypothetical protein
MVTLQFDSRSQLTLGPATGFAIEGNAIRQAPHNEIVCRCVSNLWHIEDETAASFECAQRAHVRFEDQQGRESPLYGPFQDLRFDGEQCFADGQLFAKILAPFLRWHHQDSGVRWQILNVLPAR